MAPGCYIAYSRVPAVDRRASGIAYRRSLSSAAQIELSSRLAARHYTMLKIHFTDQRQESAWVADKSFAIGSASDNHLVITDPTIAPHHVKIVHADGQFLLQDLASPAGTFVNDQRVTQKPLHHSDRLKIGEVELEVQDPLVPGTQPKWCLVACSSWLRGQEFPVDARTPDLPIKVGRASHCDMIFAGTHLSREHAQLTILGDGILVRDLNSANGTFINDLRITEGIAYPGDQLRFDVYSFRLYGPAARPRATASNDDEATQIRRPPPVIEKPAEPPFEELPKRWKTRSTSPGNRVDVDSPKDEYPLAVKVIAVSLVLAVVALVTYLIIG